MKSSPRGDGPVEHLRLDLFLKRSRLVRRRPLAALLCGNGYVTLNGREAPAGRAVKVGDLLSVRYPRRRITVEVTAIPGRGKAEEECYRVLEEEEVAEEM